jgi:hypothetical protein
VLLLNECLCVVVVVYFVTDSVRKLLETSSHVICVGDIKSLGNFAKCGLNLINSHSALKVHCDWENRKFNNTVTMKSNIGTYPELVQYNSHVDYRKSSTN